METWSAQLEKLTINFFLDTNILCYLVDGTRPTLTAFVKALSETPVAELYASEYVLSEFIGVRKQENYFQEVINRSHKEGKKVNVSEFIKHNKAYEIKDYDYDTLKDDVKQKVDEEIEKVTREFGVSFLRNTNKRLVGPMKEVCLSTKISKEDSLVLVSSLYKENEVIITEPVIILTNDGDFCRYANSSKNFIGSVLEAEGLLNPGVEHMDKVGEVVQSKRFNLSMPIDNIEKCVAEYLAVCLKSFFGDYYIGDTLKVNFENAPAHTLGINVKAKELKNGIYIAIISKNMDFIYCPPPQADFHHEKDSIGELFVPKKKKSYVSFACDKEDVVVIDEIFNKLNEDGNLVFIHPDNYLALKVLP